MFSRVSSFINAPPPVDTICGPSCKTRLTTRDSSALNSGSPYCANISVMGICAAATISSSVSTKGSPVYCASNLPMTDFPAPISPTSTRLRSPSAKRAASPASFNLLSETAANFDAPIFPSPIMHQAFQVKGNCNDFACNAIKSNLADLR